jgi:hypothetical protein
LKAQHTQVTEISIKNLVGVLEPLNNLVKVQIPWLEKKIQERGVARSEHDFYKHRVSELERIDKAENEVKLSKYRNKKSASELVYNSLNAMVTTSMKEFLEVKPLLVQKCVSQVVMFQKEIIGGLETRIGLVESFLPKTEEPQDANRLEEIANRLSSPIEAHHTNSIIWKPVGADFSEDYSHHEDQNHSQTYHYKENSTTCSQSSAATGSFDSSTSSHFHSHSSDEFESLPHHANLPEHEARPLDVAPAGLGRSGSVGFVPPPPLPPAETAADIFSPELAPITEESQYVGNKGQDDNAHRRKKSEKPLPVLKRPSVSNAGPTIVYDSEPFSFAPPKKTGHRASKSELPSNPKKIARSSLKPLPPSPKSCKLSSTLPITVIAQDDLRLSESGSDMGNFMMQALHSHHKSIPPGPPSKHETFSDSSDYADISMDYGHRVSLSLPAFPLQALTSAPPPNRDSISIQSIVSAELPHPSPPFLCDTFSGGCNPITGEPSRTSEVVVETVRETVETEAALTTTRTREQEYFEQKAKEKEEATVKAAEAEAALPPEERERLQKAREEKTKHDERKRAALKQGMQMYAGQSGGALNKFKKMPTKRRGMKSQ